MNLFLVLEFLVVFIEVITPDSL